MQWLPNGHGLILFGPFEHDKHRFGRSKVKGVAAVFLQRQGIASPGLHIPNLGFPLVRQGFAEGDFDGRWAGIVTNWFYSTARNDAERRLMRAYGVGVGDLKYSREELNQVMTAWLSVSSGKGRFESCQVSFTNGVAFFRNTEYDCLMKLELRKDWIWVHGGNVFLFATSDVDGNGGYGSSDSLYESWFLRFSGGTITGSCHFRHGCTAFRSLRYHLDVVNDFIMVTSTKTGDIVGELRLGLRNQVDSNGKKRYGKVEYSGSQEES